MNRRIRHIRHLLFTALLVLPLTAAYGQGQNESETSRPSPNEVLAKAQTILIRSNSFYFKASTLENELLQSEEFQDWGLVITRDENDADLIIEVGRKKFTTSFIYSVIDPKNKRVVASGRVNSIGGTVEGKISKNFLKRMRAARPASTNEPPKPAKTTAVVREIRTFASEGDSSLALICVAALPFSVSEPLTAPVGFWVSEPLTAPVRLRAA